MLERIRKNRRFIVVARIELDRIENTDCLKKCGKEKRKSETINELCTLTCSCNDNLPIRCVGDWAEKKIFHLVQYFGIFAIGMKNKWNINYIEICSGPGRCIDRTTGTEFDGTALAIMKHKAFPHINKAIFIDYDENVVNTINERIKRLRIDNAYSIKGDYYKPEELCGYLRKELNSTSLNLVFIDPTDCSVPFDLIKKIKSVFHNVDMIINVASGTDVNRNIINVVLEPERYTGIPPVC